MSLTNKTVNELITISPDTGDLLVWNGTEWIRLSTSSFDGYVLTSNGTGLNPSYRLIPIQNMNGDVFGTTELSTVIAIQNNLIKSQILSSIEDGYVLTWINADGYWEAKPATGSGGSASGPAGGDLSGTYPNPTVTAIQGFAVNPLAPSNGDVLTYDFTDGYWKPETNTTANAVIFDGSSNPKNIRSDKPSLQSPIDNTKAGIVNFGSLSTGSATGANADYSAILSGDQHQIDAGGVYGVIAGGLQNYILSTSNLSFIGCGQGNSIYGIASSVVGGVNNSVSANYSSITGGSNNIVVSKYCVIAGGNNNDIDISTDGYAFIGNGTNNVIGNGSGSTGANSVIVAGSNNTIGANNSVIVGGTNNACQGLLSFIGGGEENTTGGIDSVVIGGNTNHADADYSTVNGGNNNTASGESSTAEGYFSVADKYGQYSHASSKFDSVAGHSQYTRVTYNGTSVAAAPVNLSSGGGSFYTFVDNKTCVMHITIVASEAVLTSPACFVFDLLVVTSDGESTIVDQAAGYTLNIPGFTVVISIDLTTTNQLNITFTGVSADARAVATIEATELVFA